MPFHIKVLAFLLLTATAFSVRAEEDPPGWLTAYIKNGLLSLSDLSWAEPRFSTEGAQQGQWLAAMRWASQREHEQTERIRAALSAAGAPADHLPTDCYDDDLCQTLTLMDKSATAFREFPQLQMAAQDVAPYVDGFLGATSAVENSLEADPNPTTLSVKLHSAATADQILRVGLTGSVYPQHHSPPMSGLAQEFLVFRTIMETNRLDHRHTIWLKGLVAKDGWPKQSVLGETAAYDAWLLAQHADSDPLFQWSALHLMTPLVSTGDASGTRYAYLYDRIMLKISGRQRFGTQAMCKDGQIAPQPLEDSESVDRFRKAVGLPSLAVYIARFHSIAECDSNGALRPKGHE